METYYDQIAEGYNELHGAEQLEKARLIAQNITIKSSDTLLDVGCGTGHALSVFDCKKTGIDPSNNLLKQARFPVVNGVAENLPFPDNSFDFSLSLTAIHHCSDVEKAVNEMKRVSKKHIVISVLKKASNFLKIKQAIETQLTVYKCIEEMHDIIFFAQKV